MRVEKLEVEPGVRLAVSVPKTLDKPIVMLSNSIGADMTMWDELIKRLSGRFCFLRYDTRGHGKSDVPKGPYTLDQLGRDAIAILDALNIERVVFCGLSLGGLTGQWIAANSHERLSGLVLANTAANFPPAALWQDRALSVRTGGMAPMVAPTIERWFTKSFRDRSASRVIEFEEMIRATPAEGYASCCDVLAVSDLKPHLSDIRCPVLVVCGAHDPSTPPARGQEIVNGISNARLVTLEAAHISAVEAADAFAAELEKFVLQATGSQVSA